RIRAYARGRQGVAGASRIRLRQLQRRLQQREQAPELAGHQREAGVELGADVLGLRAFELVDRAVEELQLADDQVLAEHEGNVVVEHQREPGDLLARLQVLGDLVRLQL